MALEKYLGPKAKSKKDSFKRASQLLDGSSSEEQGEEKKEEGEEVKAAEDSNLTGGLEEGRNEREGKEGGLQQKGIPAFRLLRPSSFLTPLHSTHSSPHPTSPFPASAEGLAGARIRSIRDEAEREGFGSLALVLGLVVAAAVALILAVRWRHAHFLLLRGPKTRGD
jgi:hypothetical protein